MRCLRCKARELHQSGREPYRFICSNCGQHYYAVMQLVPVSSDVRGQDAGERTGTGGGG